MPTDPNPDSIWWDDDGCWAEVPNAGLGAQVLGPFTTEQAAEEAINDAR